MLSFLYNVSIILQGLADVHVCASSWLLTAVHLASSVCASQSRASLNDGKDSFSCQLAVRSGDALVMAEYSQQNIHIGNCIANVALIKH